MDAIENVAQGAANTAQNAGQYVKDSVSATANQASKETNKSVAKDSDAGVGTRASAAKDAVGDKINQTKDDFSAQGHKEAAKH